MKGEGALAGIRQWRRRSRRSGYPSLIRGRRISTTKIIHMFLILAFIAMVPPFFFHFRLKHINRMQAKRCGWLHNPPLVCAHGGDSGQEFPNTMSAYNSAILSQADCIEIDVSRSADGALLALHDRDLQRLSGNSTAKVGNFRMDEINGLIIASDEFHDKHVLTAKDALQFISKSVEQVILDVKLGPGSYEKSLAADVVSLVKNTKCRNCLVWAKSDRVGEYVMRLSPDVPVGYIVMIDALTGVQRSPLRMKMARIAGVYHPLINDKLVDTLHGEGKQVYAWTVDDEPSMQKMLDHHVDAIVTSYPLVLLQHMQKIRSQCLEDGFPLP